MQRARTRFLVLLLLAGVACGPATAASSAGSRDGITRAGDPDDGDVPAKGDDGERTPEGADPLADAPPGTEAAPDFQDPVLDAFIKTQMETSHTPGVSALVIKGGKIRFAKGYGFANVTNKTPVTPDTIFALASISKTVAGAALMHLIDAPGSGLTLDDDVSAAAGFQVRNPSYPNAKISYRHLLTHAAGIANDPVSREVPGDSPIPLAGYVRGFLTPQGQYWTPSNFAASAPGATWDYSNSGFATVAFLVQAKSGMSFEAYCQKHLFDPLAMKDTAWRLASTNVARLAIPHVWAGGSYDQLAPFGYPDWPAGTLRSSTMQLATFMRMMIGKGELGARVLQTRTVTEMLKPQRKTSYGSDQGLAWYDTPYRGRHMWGHSGSDRGVSTLMGFDPKDGLGVILLSNGNAYQTNEAEAGAFESMFSRLIDTSDKM